MKRITFFTPEMISLLFLIAYSYSSFTSFNEFGILLVLSIFIYIFTTYSLITNSVILKYNVFKKDRVILEKRCIEHFLWEKKNNKITVLNKLFTKLFTILPLILNPYLAFVYFDSLTISFIWCILLVMNIFVFFSIRKIKNNILEKQINGENNE